MVQQAEKPKHEQEILAAKEVAVNTARRREQLHRDIESRLGKFDELSRAVQTAEVRHRQAEGKYARLQEVARDSGHEDAFEEELAQCRSELRQLTERVDEAVTQLRPVEVRLLTLASDYASLDGDRESSLSALQEATEHFEGLVDGIQQEFASRLERDQAALDKARDGFEQALDGVKDEYGELMGWDLDVDTETSDNWFDRHCEDVNKERDRSYEWLTDLKRQRESGREKHQAYVSLDGDEKTWISFRDRVGGTVKRKDYTRAEIADGEYVAVMEYELEELKGKLEDHKKEKPGFFGIFGKNKEWAAEQRRWQDALDHAQNRLETARKEQEAVQDELQAVEKKIEAQAQKFEKMKVLSEKMRDVRLKREFFQNAQRNLRYAQNVMNKRTQSMRDSLRDIQETTRRLELDIDHPIMEQVRVIEVKQGQAEQEVA